MLRYHERLGTLLKVAAMSPCGERATKELRLSVMFCKVTVDEIEYLKTQLEQYRLEHKTETESKPTP